MYRHIHLHVLFLLILISGMLCSITYLYLFKNILHETFTYLFCKTHIFNVKPIERGSVCAMNVPYLIYVHMLRKAMLYMLRIHEIINSKAFR